jgi:hypothetical protein
VDNLKRARSSLKHGETFVIESRSKETEKYYINKCFCSYGMYEKLITYLIYKTKSVPPFMMHPPTRAHMNLTACLKGVLKTSVVEALIRL